MRRKRIITALVAAAFLVAASSVQSAAQPRKDRTKPNLAAQSRRDGTMHQSVAQSRKDRPMAYMVEGSDTVYFADLPPAKIWQKLPKQKGREWRKYYKMVYNFNKSYPYALVARKLVAQVDSTIAADGLKRGKREKYIEKMQEELFTVFEKPLRNLTVSQGAMLMKLIDREVGKSSYNIIKDYKNGMAAGFWQGIAKLFGTDLKKPYDAEGDDAPLEELVRLWENGDFDGLYYSLFWEFPPRTEIPSKYR